jgi:hypothetical protein
MTKQEIQQSIQSNERLSREIRDRIHTSKGLDRYAAWVDKRALGTTTRTLLLALALLRDTPYLRVERKTNKSPNYANIAEVSDLPEARVVEWLEGSVPQAVAA